MCFIIIIIIIIIIVIIIIIIIKVVGGIRELFLDVSLVIMSLFPLINNVLC